MEQRTETATFGAGCFWGVEEAFRTLPGVLSTRVGYLGGTTENPTYAEVCTDRTGHAEVVEVTFDPAVLSYEALLGKFWAIHDPTQLDRQGPDFGSQYRSAIFTRSPEQAEAARASLNAQAAGGGFARPIATRIEPAGTFYPAEEHHQKYLLKRGLGACSL